MTNYKRIIDIAEQGIVDPTSFIRPSLEAIDEAMENGFNIVTPNSPFLNLIEMSSTCAVAAMNNSNVNMRRQYRNLAQTYDDLYGHLSDRDFKGRFGNPGRADVHLILSYQWLIDNATVEASTNDRCVYIPKDSIITVNGIDFYFHHDIKIHILASGGIQVYFVINRESPIYSPTSLILSNKEIYIDGQKLVDITIPVEQLSLDILSSPVTANGFDISFTLPRDFYYARAFIKIGGVWSEVPTTHSQQVYDPDIATMVLKVTDKTLEATIPDVYINKGIAGTEARLLVYTTLGNNTTDLSQYQIGDFKIQYNDAFDDNIELWENLTSNPVALLYSTSRISDGTNSLTFQQMKDKVIYNGYGKNTSVTYDELTKAMNLRGYGIYRQKDTISDRVYVATKELPLPESPFISSSAAVTNKDVVIDIERGDIDNHVVTNGNITTLKPRGLFRSTGYDVVMASDTEDAAIRAKDPYALCDTLNNEEWFYTPFYYVLDSSTAIFRTDAYYLDEPETLTTSFVNFNPSLDYAVKTNSAKISFDGSKYTINVKAATPSSLIGLHLQLRHTDEDGQVHHLNAPQNAITGTESEFIFELSTNLAIDNNHRFFCPDLMDAAGNNQDVWVDLETEFEFIYVIEDSTITPSPFDGSIDTIGFNTNVSGVTYDKITFKFGDVLDSLNVLSKSYLMPGEVQVHNTDVPLVYEADVYQNDAAGKVYEIDGDGNVQFNILHNAGDLIIVDGEQQYKHRAGDPVVVDGNLVYNKTPYNARKVRLFLIDAKYLFADDTSATAYRDAIPRHVIESLGDIKDYDPEMLERTTLLFEPISTANLAVVNVSGGRQTSANTSVKFDIRFTMDASRYGDIQLRNSIIDTTKKTIAENVNSSEFSQSSLVSTLDKIADNVMRNVEVSTSLPDNVVSMTDNSSTFSVRTRIIPAQNQQLSIEDDISIEIVR